VSIDRRLREGFQRSAPAIAPKERTPLERVTVRARRHVMVRRAASTLFVAVVVWGVTFGGPRVMDALRDGRHLEPAQQPTPSAPVSLTPPSPARTTTLGAKIRPYGGIGWSGRRSRSARWVLRCPHELVPGEPFGHSFQSRRSVPHRSVPYRCVQRQATGRYRWQISGDHSRSRCSMSSFRTSSPSAGSSRVPARAVPPTPVCMYRTKQERCGEVLVRARGLVLILLSCTGTADRRVSSLASTRPCPSDVEDRSCRSIPVATSRSWRTALTLTAERSVCSC
jgi:hypothetical protein